MTTPDTKAEALTDVAADTEAFPQTPWWREHPSAATVLLIAGATSALYFFGSKRLDTLAKAFGLAAPPRSMGLQEVMVAGVDVFQLPVLVILFAAALLLIAVLKGVIWVHEHVTKKQVDLVAGIETLQIKVSDVKARAPEQVADSEIADLEKDLVSLTLSVSRNAKLRKVSLFAIRFSKVFKVILGSLTLTLVMVSGVLTGKMDAWLIRTAVTTDCDGCFEYVTSGRRIVAHPIFQADDKIIAYQRSGTVVIPLAQNLTIRKFTPSRKKAGQLETTQESSHSK